MKLSQSLSILSVCALSWSCGSVDPNATISLPGSRNPLDRLRVEAGGDSQPVSLTGDPSGSFQSGDYVEVIADNAPFFSEYPKSGVSPTSTLSVGTQLIVLQVDGQNMNVQTEDSKIGYVSNLSVGPQGMLVNVGGLPADELQAVDWSDMTDAQIEAANQALVGDELPEVELEVDMTPEAEIPEVEVEAPIEVESVVEPAVEKVEEAVEAAVEKPAVLPKVDATPPSVIEAE